MDQMADLVDKLRPAYENFMGFFHAIDWKEPWLIYLVSFHALFLLVAFSSRKNINLQMSLFLLARDATSLVGLRGLLFQTNERMKQEKEQVIVACPLVICIFYVLVSNAVGGVYLAEELNSFLAGNWTRFAVQNSFDTQGLFLSVLWSGPLLVTAILILVNTLFSLCHLIVRWKRADLRPRTRVPVTKED